MEAGKDDDDNVPELVENFDETSKNETTIASGLNVEQESVTLVAGNQGQNEGGLKVVQVPGSNDFTVVPVDG